MSNAEWSRHGLNISLTNVAKHFINQQFFIFALLFIWVCYFAIFMHCKYDKHK